MNARRTTGVVGLLLSAIALGATLSTPAQADPPAGRFDQSWATKAAAAGGNGSVMRAQ